MVILFLLFWGIFIPFFIVAAAIYSLKFFAGKDGKALYTQQKEDWNWLWLSHELLIVKFRHKSKKVGKTSWPFRYDLSQIPYDYTVQVINRFKGLDLIDRVPEELWTEIRDIIQEAVTKTIPKKKNARRQSACLRRLYKQLRKEEKEKAGEKGKDIPSQMQSFRE